MKKAITIIVIILLVAGGIYGYRYYKNVYLPQQDAKYEMEEKPEVETMTVGYVNSNYEDNNLPEADVTFKECLDIMGNAEGQFFIMSDSAFYDPIPVEQVQKNEFVEEIPDYGKCTKAGAKALEHFYSIKFRELKGDEFSNNGSSNSLMGPYYLGPGMIRTLKSAFNGSVQDYFYDHQLKLSCESVKLTKVGFERLEEHEGSYAVYDFDEDMEIGFNIFAIYEAQVTTDDCKGDMSDLGIFAKKGEAKTITTKMTLVNDTSLAGIYFE